MITHLIEILSYVFFTRSIVQKYLLEKSRIVSQAKKERNYHVFYYLLAGANEEERAALQLKKPQEYHYLNQVLHGFSKPMR